MQTLAVLILAAAAAIAPLDPSLSLDDGATPRCPDDAALVSGPPAAELFDPSAPENGRASWCERYDAQGRTTRVGRYTDTYPDGAARTLAHFEDDRLHGDVLILHRNGNAWLRTRFERGLVEGAYEVLRPSGTAWLRAEFHRGVAVGTHTLHYRDGSIAAESHYVDGIEQGTARAWWPNGSLRRELDVVDGIWSGRFASWFESGQPESEGAYAACPEDATADSCELIGAARHGHWQTWHENGVRASRVHWRFGEQVGTSVEWNDAGEPEVVRIHHAGDVVQEIRVPAPSDPPAVSSAPFGATASIPRAD